MNLNLRIVLAGILSVTLGLLGTISISVQGQQPATVQPIPNEPMFSTIMRVEGKYSASIGDAGWLRGPDGKNDFFHCGGGPSDILAEDDPYYDVTDLAVFIAVVSRRLKAEGTYPVAAPYLNRLIKYGDAETCGSIPSPGTATRGKTTMGWSSKTWHTRSTDPCIVEAT